MISTNVVEEVGFVGGTEGHNSFMYASFFRNEFVKKKPAHVLSLETLAGEKTKTLNHNVRHTRTNYGTTDFSTRRSVVIRKWQTNHRRFITKTYQPVVIDW